MIISLAFSIIISYIVYKCFDNYGFKQAFLFNFILNIIRSLIQNGFNHFIIGLFLVALVSFLSTGIDYFIYLKTNSFTGYLLLSIIIGVLITLLPAILISVLIGSSGLLAGF